MSSATSTASTSASSPPEWQLYYWPRLPGRGEFARLLFHETNTDYTEPFAHAAYAAIQASRAQLAAAQPFFALPLLQHSPPPGAAGQPSRPVYVSQSAVMCRYLSQQLDGGRLAAQSAVDDLRAQELLACAVDAIGEGCTAWHAIDAHGSYDSQKAQTQPFIDTFVAKRLPKWLALFEAALQSNGGQWLVGAGLTYVDVFVFQWLHGVEYQCGDVYRREAIDGLRGLKERVQMRPGIAERVRTRPQYDGTGPCF